MAPIEDREDVAAGEREEVLDAESFQSPRYCEATVTLFSHGGTLPARFDQSFRLDDHEWVDRWVPGLQIPGSEVLWH